MTDHDDDVRRLRAKPRLKLFHPTELRDAEGAVQRAHLLDLSATGALVHAAEPPASDTTVQLLVDGALRAARVMWTDGRRFGLHFRLPLSDAQVSAVLDAQATATAAAAQRVGPLSR